MGKQTILVIEDNDFNMKLVRTLLQVGGYHVVEAADAETGLALARERQPAMILMDVQLPGMDGLEATRSIGRDAVLRHIPVVALTSHAMIGDEEKALEAGCVGYIAKPIDTRSFIDTVRQYLYERPKAVSAGDEAYRHRILIVDDDPVNTKLLASMLSKDSYSVSTAHLGRLCMEKAAKECPDLILLDVMMPDIDGYTVTRRLKADPKTQQIPIMLITALDGQADKMRGLEAGADEFLNKPVNAYELRARVQSLLRLKVYQEQLTSRATSQTDMVKPVGYDETAEETIASPRVLIVEDNAKDLQLLEGYLNHASFQLSVCRDGEAAVSFLREKSCDLILLDVLLPGIDGFEVIKQLNKMPRHRNVPLVVVSGLEDLENRIRAIRLGADDYLCKPVNAEVLTARVHALLKKKAYMDRLSSQYASALHAAINDKLTGIYNHGYFKHFIDLEIKRAKRQMHPLALIMIDIDDFKHYNDTYGHPAGDALLKWIGKVIRKNIREVDVPARYGGEEFAVVLPYADRNGAPVVADRIAEAVRTEPFASAGSLKPARVTVSMGIAYYPEDAASADALIKHADIALYRAKRGGKNRICSYAENDECFTATDGAPPIPPVPISAVETDVQTGTGWGER